MFLRRSAYWFHFFTRFMKLLIFSPPESYTTYPLPHLFTFPGLNFAASARVFHRDCSAEQNKLFISQAVSAGLRGRNSGRAQANHYYFLLDLGRRELSSSHSAHCHQVSIQSPLFFCVFVYVIFMYSFVSPLSSPTNTTAVDVFAI